jgi:phage tail-like protein
MPDHDHRHALRVSWDGRHIPGIYRVSPLTQAVEVIDVREGEAPESVRKLPGLRKWPEVTFKRGLAHDTAFADWMAAVAPAAGAPVAGYRKEVVVEVLDHDGSPLFTWTIHRAWPSALTLTLLDRDEDERYTEELTLQNEGWERTR